MIDPEREPLCAAVVEIDPRLLDAVVDFTGEVADVAATLTNLGITDEAARLTGALDRLDQTGR